MYTHDHHGIIPWEAPTKEEKATVVAGLQAHAAKQKAKDERKAAPQRAS